MSADPHRSTACPPASSCSGEAPAQAGAAWLLEALRSRRSVSAKRLVEPGPSRQQIDAMVAAAITAPDHGLLRPWRFVNIGGAGRPRLAEAFVAARLEQRPQADEASLERAREKAFRGPALIAVVLCPRHGHDKVPVTEQYVSLGAALQNLLLSAHALGFGAMTLSGRAVTSHAMRDALDIAGDEQLVAFVTIGTPRVAPPGREPVDVSQHLADWP